MSGAREPWERRGPLGRVLLADALAVAIVVGAKLVTAGVVVGAAWAVLWLASLPTHES